MVKCVEKGDNAFLLFCDRDVFGTRIKAYFNCYSTDYDFVKFWVQTDDNGNVTAAISRVDGDMTVTAENADFEELLQFVKIVGFTTIQCERAVAKRFTDDEELWGYVVEFKEKTEVKEIPLKQNLELKEIYNIIKAENLTGVGDYLPWLSDTSFRINRNTAKPLLCQLTDIRQILIVAAVTEAVRDNYNAVGILITIVFVARQRNVGLKFAPLGVQALKVANLHFHIVLRFKAH